MTDRLAIALAQADPLVGDVEGNIRKVADWRGEALALGADLVIFPEMVVAGYPPEDLVLKPSFLNAIERAVERLAQQTAGGGPAVPPGAPGRGHGQHPHAGRAPVGGEVPAAPLPRPAAGAPVLVGASPRAGGGPHRRFPAGLRPRRLVAAVPRDG